MTADEPQSNRESMSQIVTQYLGMRKTGVIRRGEDQYTQQGLWFFLHANVHPHTVNIVEQFLAKQRKGCTNQTSAILARSLSTRHFPIHTTETRFERKEI
ncbi:hypothetical protein TNCV_205881 [Trichonephila clavipes]|nr:hypothetical protein TNCV_205881 [Trichonephila clavipes]